MDSQTKYGLKVIRGCTAAEEALLKRKYSQIQQELGSKSQNIVIYNFFRDGVFQGQDEDIREIHQWVQKLIDEVEPGAGCYPVVWSYILNPKGNQLSQDYHIDYADHMRTIFVNLDYLTSLNCPQYFKEGLEHTTKLSLRGGKQYGWDEKEILNRENKQCMEVTQMICKPFTILLLKPGTVHRGVANRSGINRTLFTVSYTEVPGSRCGEPKIQTQKQDIE